ncbi:MAG: hypothetical protein IJY79_05465 [Clostridia bacterium]|nr:hypothetical protein [Clostridia bacterium]
MPDYKRKKVNKFSKHKKNRVHTESTITMTNKKQKNIGVVPENDIKVVRGAKYKRKQKVGFFVAAIAFVCVVCMILSMLLPGGLYENIINFTSLIGGGSYPISISGSTILNTISCDSYYYVLTDTNIAAYSNSGKIVFDELHGFSNPILSVSGTRALVYDQGGKTAYVYNLSGKIHTLTTEKEIITASVSQSGAVAVATYSDSYTSVATVYDKNLKQQFTYNSAKDIINNVIINPSGKKMAVSTLSVVSGQYSSKLLVFNFESANPLHTADLGSSLVLSLANTGKGISIICEDRYKFLHWSKFTASEVTASGKIYTFRSTKNGVLLTFNLANNRSDNTIVLVSKKGEKLSEFKIEKAIGDIQYSNGRIYFISDTAINILDKNGNVLRYGDCSYGVQKFAVTAANSVATVSDSEINKINIEKGDK